MCLDEVSLVIRLERRTTTGIQMFAKVRPRWIMPAQYKNGQRHNGFQI